MSSLIYQNGFTATDLSSEIIEKINENSFHQNESIGFSDLCLLNLKHIGFDNCVRQGQMICNKLVCADLLKIFYHLYEYGYNIEKVRLADEYNSDDELIMADNNTSCFNYRTIANTNIVSLHGMGLAVDVNPLYNPYIVDNNIMPIVSAPYADRQLDFPYKISHEDLCYKIFQSYGWLWGGDWNRTKDYQHFYKVIR